ncbi:glycosyltransferase family 4 protein [Roseobacter sp. HKCCD5988]|uniref:glycosyltransferase family 4 protein n=1 Tax=Roseobacter sp. HKCCD5988 TaxID=3120338 RepID=UPI0030ED431B
MKLLMVGAIAESFLLFRSGLIKKLVLNNVEVHVLVNNHSRDELNKLLELGVIVHSLKISRSQFSFLSDLRTICNIYKKIKEIEPDVLFAFFLKPIILSTVASLFNSRLKLIFLVEGLGSAFTYSPKFILRLILIRFLLRIILKPLLILAHLRASHVLFLNFDDIKDLKFPSVFTENHSVVGPIGVDLRFFLYTVPQVERIDFLYVGRLIWDKGLYEYLQAIKIVKKRYPCVSFTFIGGVDFSKTSKFLDGLITEAVTRGEIIVHGKVQDVRPYIEESSVFVLPSHREGYPRSTQEAMAMGRAVITTNVPGCRETVIDQYNGFKVGIGDINALVDAICYFIEHPSECVRMGANSRVIAESNFDASVQEQKIFDIIGGGNEI